MAVTAYGLVLPGRPANFARAFQVGGNTLARVMFAPILPGSAHQTINPGLAGWIGLFVIMGGVLIWFDTWCVRRDSPRVDVPNPPPAEADHPGLEDRRMLTEELRFRLPAVEVRRPAAMPGGSTLANLARVVSDSEIRGSKTTAAAMLVVNALAAKPRRYEIRTYVECCHKDGQIHPHGKYRLITVDMRDAKTSQSLAVRVLKPCTLAEAAERVAGFTARQAFSQDVSTPTWAAGSPDGDDLSAYLLTKEMRPEGPAFQDSYACRQRKIEALENAVQNSANAGLVQYELACLYDLDGRTLESLRLHLGNLTHHPRFLRGRYRLAMSLSMLAADPAFTPQWLAAGQAPFPVNGHPASLVKKDVIRELSWSGMLRKAGEPDPVTLLGLTQPAGEEQRRIRLVLLALAHDEFRAYRRRMRAPALLWLALWYRAERSALLQLLHTRPFWLRHPRRRLLAISIALGIVDQRIEQLTHPDRADRSLEKAQRKVCRQLGVPGLSDRGTGVPRSRLPGRHAWNYGKIPWQAMYKRRLPLRAACHEQRPAPGRRPSGGDVAPPGAQRPVV